MPLFSTIASIVAGTVAYASALVVLYIAQCEALLPGCSGKMYDASVIINLLLGGFGIGAVCSAVIVALCYWPPIRPFLLRPSLPVALFVLLGSLPFAYMCVHWSCRPWLTAQEISKGVLAGLSGALGFLLVRRSASNRAVQRTPSGGRR